MNNVRILSIFYVFGLKDQSHLRLIKTDACIQYCGLQILNPSMFEVPKNIRNNIALKGIAARATVHGVSNTRIHTGGSSKTTHTRTCQIHSLSSNSSLGIDQWAIIPALTSTINTNPLSTPSRFVHNIQFQSNLPRSLRAPTQHCLDFLQRPSLGLNDETVRKCDSKSTYGRKEKVNGRNPACIDDGEEAKSDQKVGNLHNNRTNAHCIRLEC